VLQLQSLASQQNKRSKPLAIVASLNSSTTEDVLWHTTLSYHAELQADAARAAELRNDAKLRRHKNKKKAPKLEDVAAAAAAVLPPVSLHLLRPDELMSGMLTQVGWLENGRTFICNIYTCLVSCVWLGQLPMCCTCCGLMS
jgi:hypothetical protein